jgi:single-strand DNA-binding protein
MVSKMTDVTRVGNLTNEPELRFTPAGKAVCNFDLAYNNYNRETKTTDDTTFYRITVWEKMGENTAMSVKKGDRVIVTGRASTREWTTKEGEKRLQKEITANAIGADLRWSTVSITRNERNGPKEQEIPNDQDEMF